MAFNLPLPVTVADVGPGGGLVTAMRGVNALQSDQLKNQIAKSEAAYAPYTSYADAASKLAYAKYLSPQIQASIMSSPAFSQLSGDQQRQIVQNYQNSMNALANGGGGINIPAPNQMGSQSGNILGNIMSLLGAKSPISGNVNPMSNMGQSMPQGGAFNPMANMGGGNQQMPPIAPNQTQSPTGAANTPAAIANRGAFAPDTNPISPAVSSDIAVKTDESAALGQQQNQTAEQLDIDRTVDKQSTLATSALKQLENFHKNYLASKYKGQYLGSTPSSGSSSIPTLPGHTIAPEQLADVAKSKYIELLSQNANTDQGRQIVENAKGLTRSLDDQAEINLYQQQKAELQRQELMKNFREQFKKNNPNATAEQWTAMWNAFNQHDPAFDYENGKVVPDNTKRWKEYTKAESLDRYNQDGDFIAPREKPKQNTKAQTSFEPGTIDPTTANIPEKDAVAAQGVVPYVTVRNPKNPNETLRLSVNEARRRGVNV